MLFAIPIMRFERTFGLVCRVRPERPMYAWVHACMHTYVAASDTPLRLGCKPVRALHACMDVCTHAQTRRRLDAHQIPSMHVHVNAHHGVDFEMSKDSFTHACVQQTRKSEGLHSCMQTRSVGISAVSAEQTGPFTMKGFAEIMMRPLHTEETCK